MQTKVTPFFLGGLQRLAANAVRFQAEARFSSLNHFIAKSSHLRPFGNYHSRHYDAIGWEPFTELGSNTRIEKMSG